MTELRIKRFIIECSEHDAAILNDGWDIMPAPPNDWRPVCFYNWGNPSGSCEMSELQTWREEHRECRSCPFRFQAQQGQVKE